MSARAAAALLVALGAGGCMPELDEEVRARRLIVARAFAPVSLDPGQNATSDAALPIDLAYEQLTTLAPDSPVAAPVGELAERWTVASDGLAIDMVLKAGRRFSDGAPVDAAAVRYSFDRVKRIGRTSSTYLEWLDRVEVTGPLTFRLHLKRRYAPALQLLAQQAASIVNPAMVRAHDRGDDGKAWLNEHSAGSGPYLIASHRPDQSTLLVRNPKAAVQPRHFREIEIRALPDEGVRRLLLERGDIDLTDMVPAAFVDRYRALPGVEVAMQPGGTSLSYLTLNTRRGPLSRRALRQAVAAAIDYRGLREQVLKGNAVQLGGFLVPGTPGYDPAELPRLDLALARRLVGESGYRGERLVMLVTQLGPVAEFLQANLRAAGLNVAIERRQPGARQAQAKAGLFDLLYEAWSLDTPDALPMLDALVASRSRAAGLNNSGYADAGVDRLIDGGLIETDVARRRAVALELDRRLRRDLPIVMIFAANPVMAYRSDLRGVTLDPFRPSVLPLHLVTRVSTRGERRP